MRNVRPHTGGWQLYSRIGGQFISEWVDHEPTAADVRNWLAFQRTRATRPDLVTDSPEGSTLAEDVRDYLKARASMPSLRFRREDLALWVGVFGHRTRASLTSLEIRQQLERWKANGPRKVWSKAKKRYILVKGPLANNTVNHRRTALMSLYTVLDGKSAPNPVRDVPRFEDDSKHAPPRAIPPDLVDTILAHMQPSDSRARLKVLRWTGWPHAQIGRLLPEHIDWKEHQVWIAPRRKGKGVKGQTLPVLPQAIDALKELKARGAWGSFSASSLRAAWLRSWAKVKAEHAAGTLTLSEAAAKAITKQAPPYDLRHTFGTMLALITKDRKARQRLMLHGDPRQTDRYEEAAADPSIRAALREVEAAITK